MSKKQEEDKDILSKEEVQGRLKAFGKDLSDQIHKDEPPSFKLPLRTKSNVYFDEINKILPTHVTSSDEIDDVLVTLSAQRIDVVHPRSNRGRSLRA